VNVGPQSEQEFSLVAQVSSHDPEAIAPLLWEVLPAGSTIVGIAEGFQIEARVAGESARELNRALLSTLRRRCRRTRIRAEWTDAQGRQQRFFDYTLRSSS
jgi:hypothetical protein